MEVTTNDHLVFQDADVGVNSLACFVVASANGTAHKKKAPAVQVTYCTFLCVGDGLLSTRMAKSTPKCLALLARQHQLDCCISTET
jgi:hypothetical protein